MSDPSEVPPVVAWPTQNDSVRRVVNHAATSPVRYGAGRVTFPLLAARNARARDLPRRGSERTLHSARKTKWKGNSGSADAGLVKSMCQPR